MECKENRENISESNCKSINRNIVECKDDIKLWNYSVKRVLIETSWNVKRKRNRQTSLHSTMFLLIPIASGHRRKRSHFTFHDVSINTPSLTTLLTASLTLHSTMFLLILCLEVITQNHLITLHSTMFLLIHLVKHPS